LNSPDYAFTGDIEERSNHYNQLHNVMYPNQNDKIVVKN
jgi:murein L,D-transpeptidase YafK